MPPTDDRVVSAITADTGFRVFAARTTRTVRGVLGAQKLGPGLGQTLGELLSASVLLRTAMAPGLRVQCILRGANGQGTLIADSHPSGATRGLSQLPSPGAELRLEQGAVLQAMRTLHDGRIHQGLVEVPSGGGIDQAFMAYLQQSEQTVSMAGLATLIEDGSVTAAGGYLVQMLPDAPYEAIETMTRQLEQVGNLSRQLSDPGFEAEALLSAVLGDIAHELRSTMAVRYECWCSEVRVVSALATLDRSEIESLLEGGNPVEVSCDYCGAQYRIAPARLQGLLAKS